jgi:hypothetical protein
MANEKDPAASTASTAQAEQTTESTSPKFMTADDFNGAMTARERRFEQRIQKLIEQSFATRQSAPVAHEGAEGEGEETQEGQEAAAKKPSGPDLAIKRATAKIEALHRQMQAKEEAAAKEKSELLQRQEKSDVIAALTSAGVTTAKGAYALLKEEGRIKRNADGELVMVVAKEYGEDEVPVADGVKHWLSTDEGKHFALPRGGGEGSGTVIRGNAPRTRAPSKEEAKRDAQKVLSQFILGSR